MKLVIVSGGFDPIHSGHIAYFRSAKSHGDKLIVALNSDAWLEKKKGKFFMPFDERKAIIESIKFVDEVINFKDDSYGSCINALEKINVDTRVMSALPIQSICETYIRRRAIRHMEKGRIVICAAGTGNPYFSTDTASALRAAELSCDAIYKATQVDGIYNKDPKKFKNAKKYEKISYKKYLTDNLKVMDSSAIAVAQDNNIPIIVFSIAEKNCLIKTYTGKNKSTEIS